MEAEREQVEAMAALEALLYRGDEHPRMLSLVGGLYLLERPPPQRRLMQSLERASRAFPRLRQRAVVPPLRLVLPHWVDDPDFDLASHVRHVPVAAPGSLREVLDTIRPELSSPLDDDRPLWEALLLCGIEGGRSALFLRMSHAMMDGIGALRLSEALFDAGPAPAKKRFSRSSMPAAPSPAELQGQALARMPREALAGALRLLPGLLGTTRSALQNPAAFARAAEGYVASVRRVTGLACPPAPALSGRGFSRRCAVMSVPLPRLKRAARKLKSSINDLYLAAIAGALHRYQTTVGVAPKDVPLAVPVNLRRGNEPSAGNYIGALNLTLPASEPDPVRRLQLIREAVQAGRAEPALRAHSLLAPLLSRMPDILLERVLAVIPRADVQASNMPGPAARPYLAGRRVLAAYPFGPVPAVGAMITMLSVADECFVGVHLDPASFTRPEALLSCLQEGFSEILEAGGQPGEVESPFLDHGPAPAGRVRHRRS
jgi:WS/DGAT/MGAT family acyltransferase